MEENLGISRGVMRKNIEDKLMLGVGTIIGLTIVDIVKERRFDFKEFLIRTIVIVVLYVIFAFIESRRQKNMINYIRNRA